MATNVGGNKIIITGVVFGLVTMVLLYVYLRKYGESHRSSWPVVVVAKVEIAANSKISHEKLATIQVPPESIVPGAFGEIKGLEGRWARNTIRTNAQLTESDLMLAGELPGLGSLIPAGKRAIAIEANEVKAVGSVIKPGDHVDVLATYRDPFGKEETTMMLLQNVLVIAVNQGQTDPTKVDGAKTSMTLVVGPEETERLTAADRAGILRVALRSPKDTTVINSTGVTMKDISFGKAQDIPSAPVPSVAPVVPVAPVTRQREVEKEREIIIYHGTEARPVRP